MAQYHVLSIWWPDGWEPRGPSDVPNCAWQTELNRIEPPPLERVLTRDEALSTVRALNRQAIDNAADRWYVAAALEKVPEQSSDNSETYRVDLIRLEAGAGRGDCSACPASGLDCASADRQGEPFIWTVARAK